MVGLIQLPKLCKGDLLLRVMDPVGVKGQRVSGHVGGHLQSNMSKFFKKRQSSRTSGVKG